MGLKISDIKIIVKGKEYTFWCWAGIRSFLRQLAEEIKKEK